MTDRDARSEIARMMDAHGDRLLRLCTLYLKDVHLAEDAVQETFLKAWRRLGSYRGESRESTWLSSIAINVCRDLLRTPWMRRINRDADIAALPECAQAAKEPDGTVLTQVMALSARHRAVILLRFYQGMTIQETADALHLSIAAVKQRQHKANLILRERLKEWYYDE